MNIQYINKENHEVMDDQNYLFHQNEIKEVPEKLGEYLTLKYPMSFVKAKDIIKKSIKIKEKIQNIKLHFIMYVKNLNSNKFKEAPFVAGR